MNIQSGISLPGGTKIVATGADARLRVVDADTVNGTGEHPAIDSSVHSPAVHPSAGSVVVRGAGGQIRRIFPAPSSRSKR